MQQILYQYQLNLTTWTYLSSLLSIALFFKFSRLWSLRNLDLLGLVALAPGLLLVQHPSLERVGYLWLFIGGGVFLLRLLSDSLMARRPLLEPNLSPGGMTFIGAWLLVFLMANVLTKDLTVADLEGPRRLGEAFLLDGAEADFDAIARTVAIVSHLLIVVGMVVIGVRHFDNIRTGIAAATLYLLMPYTAEMTARVYHVLPAALLIWVVVAYRRPLLSGTLLGLATGVIYYPVFLLPLWGAFYWRRGLVRFLTGWAVSVAAVLLTVWLTAPDPTGSIVPLTEMRAWLSLDSPAAHGFWKINGAAIAPYRVPVFVAFAAMCASFALWPAQKNLGTLLSCSAAVMLGTQFWHAQGGGLCMAWYLPLLLLTIYRPNLEDRVAVSTLGEGWWPRRRLVPRAKTA